MTMSKRANTQGTGWVTIDEAARLLGYKTREPVQRRIARGEIPTLPRRKGETYRIPRSALESGGSILYDITTRDGTRLTTRDPSVMGRHAEAGAEIRVLHVP